MSVEEKTMSLYVRVEQLEEEVKRLKEVLQTLSKTVGEDGNEETESFEGVDKTSERDMYGIVTNLLHDIGIPANLKGYQYIRTAIMLALDNAEYLENMTKMLYPDVGQEYHTTSSRTERAIRHAIEVAWERGNERLLDKIFGCSINPYKGKPTNSEFIATLIEYIKFMR